MPATLKTGDRVRLSGGYEMEPPWMGDAEFYLGEVVEFIPGQNETPAAVVKLASAVTVEGTTGSIVVLELRYAGAVWNATETVHVELCDFMPEARPWKSRRQGKWVESHATCRKI